MDAWPLCKLNFIFSSKKKINIAPLNAPGTFHDSTMVDYDIYEKIQQVYNDTEGKVVEEPAFNISEKDYLIKYSQQDPADGHALLVNQDATSVRQLSDWGMRMIQGSFPRLANRIKYEEREDRKVNVYLMVHLYTYQTSQVGINQILNSFL